MGTSKEPDFQQFPGPDASLTCSLRPAGRSKMKATTKKLCTFNLIQRRLPFLSWMPSYTLKSAFHDCIAGFTVALTAIPQGIAYGAVAGLPVEYGLYTAFAGPFIYALLGSIRQITVGPTAVMALMTLEYTQKGGAPYAIVLSFLAGCLELFAGVLNLGWVMDFISSPVVSGFCSAAATTVVFSQLKTILGLKFQGSSFLKVFPGIIMNLQDVKTWDAVLGFSFILFLVILKNLTILKKCCSGASCWRNRHFNKAVWFISTCRNALAVLFGCILAYALEIKGYEPFTLTGEIQSGIPSFHIPPFSFERLLPNTSMPNSTEPVYEWITFDTIIADLGTGLIMVPAIAILEQVAIAKAFSNGKKTDSTQEMIALGFGSIFCSFFGCMPLTASFSRSSVLSASGGKTQLANVFNGSVILIALSFLMPTFYYIPKAVLGAVIIVASFSMIEFGEIMPMWRGRRIELVPFATTFFCCLLINIEYGILIGALIHLLLLTHEASRTKSVCNRYQVGGIERIVIKVDRNLYFPSVERLREALDSVCNDDEESMANCILLIDMSNVSQVDHTSLKVLNAMVTTWEKMCYRYSFVNVSEKVEKALRSVLPFGIDIQRASIDIESAFGDEHSTED